MLTYALAGFAVIMLASCLDTPLSGLFQLAQLSHLGIVSDRDLVAKIHDRRFAVILLFFDPTRERDPYWLRFYTPGILGAIENNYELDAGSDMPGPLEQRPENRFYVYVPRPAGTGQSLPGRLGASAGISH